MGSNDRRRRTRLAPGEEDWVKARATTAIEAGQVLRVISTTAGGAYFNVVPAISDGSQTGTLKSAIAQAPAGDPCWVKSTDLVALDTSSCTLGDTVYLSDTTPGELSLTSTLEPVGWVTEVAVDGRAYIDPAASEAASNGGTSPVTLITSGGGQTGYSTITAALAASVSGDVVMLAVGTYNESITIPDGVRVRGNTGAQTVVIAGADTTSTRVTLAGSSTLYGATVVAPSSGGNPGIDCTGLAALKIAVLNSVVVQGAGGTGPLIKGAGSGQLALLEVYHNGGTTTGHLVEMTAGDLVVDALIPNAGSVDAVFKISNATLQGQNITWGPFWSGTSIFELGANAEVGFIGIGEKTPTPTVTQGVHITAGPVTLQLEAASLRSTATDFLVDPGVDGTGSSVRWSGVVARQETFSSPSVWNANVDVVLQYLDNGIENNEAVRVGGGFSVGATSNSASSDFGAGAPVVNSMAVLSYDGTSTWVDNTAAAASKTGSVFNIFQSTAVGETCLVGADFTFTDVPFDIVSGITSGTIVAEISDGASGWTAIEMMEHDGSSPYEQRANLPFTDITPTDKFLILGDTTGWATDTYESETKYWLRLRVTALLSAIPTAQRFRVGRSRSTFSNEGHPMYFGVADVKHTFWEGSGESLSAPNGGANSPNTDGITISTNVSYNQAFSRWNNGNNERAGTQIEIPVGADTSKDFDFDILWYTDGTSTNTVRWQIYAVEVRSGDVVGALTEQSVTNDVAGTGTALEVQKTTFTYTFPDVVPGDEIAFMIWRQGTTDTNPDDATILTMAWSASFWS